MAKYIDIEKEIAEMQQVVALFKDNKTFGVEITSFAFQKIIDKLKQLPAEDVAPVIHGKWIERWHENKHVIGNMACSVCGTQMLLTFPKFCPHCGAKMDRKDI